MITCDVCIISPNGVKAYAGDTVKFDLAVKNGWGDRGTIESIDLANQVVRCGDYGALCFPFAGIIDFKVLKRGERRH